MSEAEQDSYRGTVEEKASRRSKRPISVGRNRKAHRSSSVLESPLKSGLNKYSVLLSSNILRNASLSTKFSSYTRFQKVVPDYQTNVPYYNPKSSLKKQIGPTFGFGERKPVSTRNPTPPPNTYTLPSPFDTISKAGPKCRFGSRLDYDPHIAKSRAVPGPGYYKVPSFVDNKYSKRFSFYPRLETKVSNKGRSHSPAPNAYKMSFTQTEILKQISFGQGEKIMRVRDETLGPGLYTIKTPFEKIVEDQQKLHRYRKNTQKQKERAKHRQHKRPNIHISFAS